MQQKYKNYPKPPNIHTHFYQAIPKLYSRISQGVAKLKGGGYAIWDFRSGAQDGDSDVQEITKVESLGGGKFKVHYNDMGNKGAHILTVVLEDGNVRFDEISE